MFKKFRKVFTNQIDKTEAYTMNAQVLTMALERAASTNWDEQHNLLAELMEKWQNEK